MNESELIQKWLNFKGRDWTQKRLSMESGLAENTISFILNGKSKVTIESLKKICSALGITLEEFYRGAPSEKLGREIPLSPEKIIPVKGEVNAGLGISRSDAMRYRIWRVVCEIEDEYIESLESIVQHFFNSTTRKKNQSAG